MNQDQEEFARKITAYLDQGTAGLRAGTVYRLQQARARALAQLAPQPVAAPESRLAHALAGRGAPRRQGVRRGFWLGLGVLTIAAAVFGYQQWQFYQQTREIEELDVQILTSDLPIDAYVDRGFQTWLTSYQR
ncbi:MAG: DUF3619 family protein [Burkholderiales bacterium]